MRWNPIPRAALWVVILLGWAAAPAGARDRKAEQLAVKAVKLAKGGREGWKTFITSPADFPDKEMESLIQRFEKAIDYFHESLEIEEHPGLSGQILHLAKRLRRLRFEEMMREAADRDEKREKTEPKAKPKPKSEPEKPSPLPAEPEPPDEPARPNPLDPYPIPPPTETPDPPREEQPDRVDKEERGERVVLPELDEPKAVRRRNTQRLRNFLMHDYFASRKSTALVKRCNRCNGHGKVPSGVLDNRRRPVFVKCGSCDGAGFHLQPNVARKGFWLCHSPLYRSDSARADEFQAQLEAWKADPRSIPEFLRSLKIDSIDNHGLWAIVEYRETGSRPKDKKSFKRKVKRMVIRLGRRWYFFNEETDAAIFSDEGADDEPE